MCTVKLVKKSSQSSANALYISALRLKPSKMVPANMFSEKESANKFTLACTRVHTYTHMKDLYKESVHVVQIDVFKLMYTIQPH